MRHEVETVVKVDPAALAAALRIAGGDRARVEIQRDGSVVVRNTPRATPTPTGR